MVNQKIASKKIVCLGGGIGTVNLIRGLKEYTNKITVIVSMADEGGSSGRLRRLYHIPPPGDLISCMAAICPNKNKRSALLTYRFPGNRYGEDSELCGHKLGNLIMVAMCNIAGSFYEAIPLFQKTFDIPGRFFPATNKEVLISAKTIEGKEIFGEEIIDLGKYDGKRVLERVFLHPKNAAASPGVVSSLKEAQVIIAGPGDLYTTILPVLIVPDIAKALIESKAKKIFIVNVANKPFETKNYSVSDYVKAVGKHLGMFPFDKVIVNTNFSVKIPKKYRYSFVSLKPDVRYRGVKVVKKDILDEDFPLYHNSRKLAKAVYQLI